jgi:hypothetical protein
METAARAAAFVPGSAGCGALAVDLQVIPPLFVVEFIAEALAHDGDAAAEDLVDGGVEAADVVVGERRALAEGVDAGLEQDLVGVGIPDAGDELVVGEDVLDM